ncbi:MAG: pilus assembly protein N-terminal domain-containing protein [Proteobacteria bacterium]|nr:pilus assembly protein N-terminal domain-containing protein [Pseudomonadota bacterium]
MRRLRNARMLFWTAAAMLTLAASTCAAGAAAEKTLIKGQSETVSMDYSIGDVAVADRSVCDYLVSQDRGSIYLNARGGGQTMVTIWDADGSIRDEISVRVVTTTLKEALERVEQAVGGIAGVTVELSDGKVRIGGATADPDDFRAIEAISQSDPRVRSSVRITKDVLARTGQAIRDAIDVPGVTVRAVRDRIALEGTVFSAADAKRAIEIARLHTPHVMDLIEVRDSMRSPGRASLIQLEFHLMEIKKQALRELAFNWSPGSFPQGGAATASAGGGAGLMGSIGDMGKSVLGFVFNFVPKLRFIRERGDGRVLENPSVVVKNGEEAQIFSGSEVPFLSGEQVQFKRVGVDIKASPIEVAGGVDLRIAATLSAPSADIRGAVDTHTVSTTAVCPLGHSVMLGGIVRNNDVKMRNRVPRDTDTSSSIFSLFLSKDFQSNRSEFVIVVTPRVMSQPEPAEAALRDFLDAEEAMAMDRSNKEHAERFGAPGDGAAGDPSRRRRPKKWR